MFCLLVLDSGMCRNKSCKEGWKSDPSDLRFNSRLMTSVTCNHEELAERVVSRNLKREDRWCLRIRGRNCQCALKRKKNRHQEVTKTKSNNKAFRLGREFSQEISFSVKQNQVEYSSLRSLINTEIISTCIPSTPGFIPFVSLT